MGQRTGRYDHQKGRNQHLILELSHFWPFLGNEVDTIGFSINFPRDVRLETGIWAAGRGVISILKIWNFAPPGGVGMNYTFWKNQVFPQILVDPLSNGIRGSNSQRL